VSKGKAIIQKISGQAPKVEKNDSGSGERLLIWDHSGLDDAGDAVQGGDADTIGTVTRLLRAKLPVGSTVKDEGDGVRVTLSAEIDAEKANQISLEVEGWLSGMRNIKSANVGNVESVSSFPITGIQ